MDQKAAFSNREQLYTYYDDYAAKRRKNIDKHRLDAGKNLLKSYVLETSQKNGQPDIAGALKHTSTLQLVPFGDEGLGYLVTPKGEIGYVEPLGSRYFALHTLRDNNVADRTIQRLTEQAPKIDALWLSGEAFQQLLEQWVVPNTPTRYVHLKAEYEPRFERGQAVEGFTEDEDGMGDGEGAAAEASSRLDLSEFSALYRPAQRLSRNLQQYRQVDPSWRAVKMLRIPSNQYGGYDLYSWGKMTYRSPDFREGVGKLRFVTDLYEKITQAIESLVWMHAEETEPGGPRRFHGLPVVFQFDQMLAAGTFENFIDQTFEQRKGPFRLWGNPIAVGPGRFHVYGVDLHMWQQVYMELSLDRFLFVLPRGTCGNTIHRLMTNIQRFLDPGVKMTIGETDYGGMVRNALFDREVINA